MSAIRRAQFFNFHKPMEVHPKSNPKLNIKIISTHVGWEWGNVLYLNKITSAAKNDITALSPPKKAIIFMPTGALILSVWLNTIFLLNIFCINLMQFWLPATLEL